MGIDRDFRFVPSSVGAGWIEDPRLWGPHLLSWGSRSDGSTSVPAVVLKRGGRQCSSGRMLRLTRRGTLTDSGAKRPPAPAIPPAMNAPRRLRKGRIGLARRTCPWVLCRWWARPCVRAWRGDGVRIQRADGV